LGVLVMATLDGDERRSDVGTLRAAQTF